MTVKEKERMTAQELTLGDIVEKILEEARKSHWPPEGATVTKVEVDLQEKLPDCLSSDKEHGYRVRKVEWYGERKFKKYGLSWKTGEWLLVPEGGGYAEETFLEVKSREATCP